MRIELRVNGRAATVDVDPVPMLPPKDDSVVTPPDPVAAAADGHGAVDPATMTPLGGSNPEPAAPKPAAPEPAAPEPGAPADPA